MALTDDSLSRSRKPAPMLPKRPTPVDMAGLDLAFSNVASLPRFEDETVRYDPAAGRPAVVAFDDLPTAPRAPRSYPTVPAPFAAPVAPRGVMTRTMALLQQIAQRQQGTRLSSPPAGYRSENVENRIPPTEQWPGGITYQPASRPDPVAMERILARARGKGLR
jgi:hypothetical protein